MIEIYRWMDIYIEDSKPNKRFREKERGSKRERKSLQKKNCSLAYSVHVDIYCITEQTKNKVQEEREIERERERK